MKSNSLLRAIAVLSLTAILASCASNQAFQQAAHDLGVAKAETQLRDQPDECGKDTPHAAIAVGEEAVVALRNERKAKTAESWSKHACYIFNKAQIDGLRITGSINGGTPAKR